MDIQKSIQSDHFQQINIIKSPNDQKSYQFIILSNQLKILLINHTQAQKSACSISLQIGSLHDPQQALGLAHFLQHMLFMGSKNHPLHTQYAQFISLNSGSQNAFTEDDQTNYYFDLIHSKQGNQFQQAIQRLCDFFKGALFNQDCIQKQIQAVHEEFILQMNDDQCRRKQIIKKLAYGPFKNFNLGNNKTLDSQDENLRDILIKFYDQYYSADLMTAVIYSFYSLQEMKQKFIRYFEQIPVKGYKQIKYQISYPLNGQKKYIPKLIRIQSIFNEQILQFFWILDHLELNQKYHIKDYIIYVLKLDSQNSLLSLLHNQNYAQQIDCHSIDLKTQTLINLTVTLTTKGKCAYEKVYNIVLDYMNNLKAQKHIYNQLKYIKELQFQFPQIDDLQDYICQLSSSIHKFKNKKYSQLLLYKSNYQPFQENIQLQAAINFYLSKLKPQNLIVVFSNDDKIKQKNVQIQQYFRTRHQIKNSIQRKIYNMKFKSISQNNLLPIDKTLKSSQNNQSIDNLKILFKDSNSKIVYYYSNPKFKVCKGGIRILIHPLKGQQNYSYNFLRMYADFLQEIFSQVTSKAQQLQLQIQFNLVDYLSIDLYGYNDIVKKTILKLGQKIFELHEDQNSRQIFNNVKDSYIEDLQNFQCDQLGDVAQDMLQMLLKQNRVLSPEDMAEQAEKYKYKAFIQKALQLWKNVFFEWIIVGNFTQIQANEIVNKFEQKFQKEKLKNKIQIQPIRCMKLNKKQMKYELLLDDSDIKTSCCLIYFEAGYYTEKMYFLIQMIENYMNQPFYNQLRTHKQLAYELSLNSYQTRGILGLYFLLISSTRDPQFISRQIKIFIKNFIKKTQIQLTDEKFNKIKKSVKNAHKTQPINLSEQYQFTCSQIQNKTFNFDRRKHIQQFFEKQNITKKVLIEQMKKIFDKSLEIMIVSKIHQKSYKANRPKHYKFDDIKEDAKYFDDIITRKMMSII